ncbi:MAG: hypothetical protein Q6M04_05580 [Thermostichus sp. BF3_bins_97]
MTPEQENSLISSVAELRDVFVDLDGRVREMDGRVQNLDSRVQNLDDRVRDLDDRVRDLDARVAGVDARVERLDAKVEQMDHNQQIILSQLQRVSSDLEGLKQETALTNTRVEAYQKASNQVVNLAFTLVGSATVALVILAVRTATGN